MPVCDVCDSEEFDLLDGLYFCSICQTQTQEIRDEHIEAADADTWQQHAGQRIRVPKERPKEDVKDYGRPWLTCEAFQIILVKQSECLMKMGASPKLKDVVFALWARYLQKTGQAYCDEVWTSPDTSCFVRDVWPGSVSNPIVEHVRKKMTIEAKNTNSKLEKQKKREEIEMTIGEEEFYEGDNPLEGIEQEEEESKAKNAPVIDHLESSKIRGRSSIGYMSIRRTLSILYLACLFTESPVLASDLIRWATDGSLPFRNVIKLLPDNMKLTGADSKTFLNIQMVPKTTSMMKETAWIAHFLGQTTFPHPSIRTIASIWLTRLNLPDELHGCVQTLISRRAQSYGELSHTVLPYESIAMAYIVILLKLFFGLDGKTEKLYSNYARMLSKKIQTNQRLFVWDEWVHCTENRRLKKAARQRPLSNFEALHCSDIDVCLKDESKSQEQLRLVSSSTNQGVESHLVLKQIVTRNKLFEENKREAMSHCLRTWLERDRKMEPKSNQDICVNMEEDKSIDELLNDELLGENVEQTDDKFNVTTIAYVRDGADFLKHKGNYGLSSVTLSQLCQETYSSSQKQHLSDEDENNNTEGEDEGEDEEEVERPKKRRRLGSSPNKVKHFIDAHAKVKLAGLYADMSDKEENSETETHPESSQDTNQEVDMELEEMQEKIEQVRNNYVFYNAKTTELHLSYNWLLEVCSCYIDTTPAILHGLVLGLESILLCSPEETRLLLPHTHPTWQFFTKYKDYVNNISFSKARYRTQPNVLEQSDKKSWDLQNRQIRIVLNDIRHGLYSII